MKKILVSVQIPITYVQGHIRYAHLDGDFELTPEEYEEFKKSPALWAEKNCIEDSCMIMIDDAEVDWCDGIEYSNLKYHEVILNE